MYVNLDSACVPEISWEQQYGKLDRQDVLKDSAVDWDAVEYDFTWSNEGAFNWKLMQDNYNEVHPFLLVHGNWETPVHINSATTALQRTRTLPEPRLSRPTM